MASMSADLPHILAIDDDDRLRELLQKFLSKNGFRVSVARDAPDARAKLAALEFDLMILDLMMPGESGLNLAANIRKTNPIPILMLTAMADSEDRIVGLENGADDSLTKPFEPRELLLRINNILRRQPALIELKMDIQMGDVLFDQIHDTLNRNGELIHLTSIETSLLKVLAKQPNNILSREELIERTGAAGGGRAVDVQVTRLRRKIEKDPKLPRYLQTVRGKGYVLRPD
jgi:two-component system phosphate regulon response regulator OmpR